VQDNSDKTPKTLLSLDHYIKNDAIYTLIKLMYKCSNIKEWANWAADNAEEAQAFYTEPYGYHAKLLGYGNKFHQAVLRMLNKK